MNPQPLERPRQQCQCPPSAGGCGVRSTEQGPGSQTLATHGLLPPCRHVTACNTRASSSSRPGPSSCHAPQPHLCPRAHHRSPSIWHHWPHLPFPAALLNDVTLLWISWSFLGCLCCWASRGLQCPPTGPSDNHLLGPTLSQTLPLLGSLP